MALPTFFPIRPSRTQRCGLRYPRKAEQCLHCAGLNEQELAALRERVQEEHEGAADLVRFMGSQQRLSSVCFWRWLSCRQVPRVETSPSSCFNAADTLKRVSLELGGKSPNIVF